MNLAIDIGNTYTHLGLYNNNKRIKFLKFQTNILTSFPAKYKELLKYSEVITSIGISSVVPKSDIKWSSFIRKQFSQSPLIVNNLARLSISIKINNSKTLGADRICNAVFGYEHFKRKENVIIVDLGTANKYDIVLKNGDFVGGIIAPGIETSAKALNINTAKLPILNTGNLKFRKSLIGNNTHSTIEAGLLYYPLFATESIVKSVEKQFNGKFKVIITGGFAKTIQKRLNLKTILVKNTVLDGINYILNYQKSVS